ncbi:hypothetical protein FACS1894164_14170 [Spirochaetia bacterium]|nr:hypothetical protein FACS1894164_14170 [Spirochaetia bacterium]
MGKINFLTGKLHGKIGAVVGSTWKGEYYVKDYAVPANPQTPKQMAGRNIFSRTTRRANSIRDSVLKPYLYPKPHKMTEANLVVSWNKDNFKTKVWEPAHFAIFEGQLPGQCITSVTYDPATRSLTAGTDYTETGPRDTDSGILVMGFRN